MSTEKIIELNFAKNRQHAELEQSIKSSSIRSEYWCFTIATWVLLGVALAVSGWAYRSGLDNLMHRWEVEEEYNHGYFLPLVTLTFLWQLAPVLAKQVLRPTWFAIPLLLLALTMFVVGELSAIYLLIHYSFILVLLGLSLGMVGWSGTRLTFVPIALLIFAIPIPYFLESALTAKLQLISSKLGVDLIRLCKIPVFREGNLIDLGVFKLEVIEACSGLTYLYPLLGFGAICAYLYHTETWKRALLIVSTIPISILLNSFRIGMIGFLVKYFGNEQAEGFLHDFEGFAVFMVCVAILFVEMWLMTFIGKDRRPFRQVFGLVFEELDPECVKKAKQRPVPQPLMVSAGLIAMTAVIIGMIGNRSELKPERTDFSGFPLMIASWQGKSDSLEPEVIKTLELTDYLLTDFTTPSQTLPVNFYVAYYESQRKGASPHSPTVCLPGGGWLITEMQRRQFPASVGRDAAEFNRVVIQKGNSSQLVYYWFEERGRIMADEYQMKWYLFRDAILENRTDGALIRVITPISESEPADAADNRLQDFLTVALPLLPNYVPN